MHDALPDSHPELPIDPDVLQPRTLSRPAHLRAEFQLIVFAGGCFGALARYELAVLLPAQSGTWPVATFITNMIGALLLGALLEGLVRRGDDSGARRLLRLGIGTGFIGAFTTYSTLAAEADLLIRGNHAALAFSYAIISMVSGVVLGALGIKLAAAHRRQQTERNP